MKNNLPLLIFSTLALNVSIIANAQNFAIHTIAGNGTAGYSGNGGPATAAELDYPSGVAIDASGNMYITDRTNNRVRKVNTSGTISTFAGNGTGGFSGDGGNATAAELNGPIGIAVDGAGNVYICDAQNNRIRMVNTSGIISTVAGNGSYGFSGDGGPATSADLGGATGIAVDALGNIYIADAPNNRVRFVNTSAIISTIGGNGVAANTGDGGPATAAEITPYGINLDASGNIYITTGSNVRMINTSGIISNIAGNGTGGYSGDGGPATAAQLSAAAYVAADASGNVYIDDLGNNLIRMVNTSGIISTVAGNRTAGYSGDGGAAIYAEIDTVYGITANSGNIYLADAGSQRVRYLCPATETPDTISGSVIVCSGSPQTYSIATVTGATSYTWVLPSGWTGTSTTNSITVTPGTNSGYVEVAANNSCGPSPFFKLYVTIRTAETPSICYVTVDTTSTHNEIFWDKSGLDTLGIDSFKVYRKITSFYAKIGEVPVSAFPSLIDTTSNPNAASQLYELSTVDICGQESPLSTNHQTILLQANFGVGGVINLSWNAYVGDSVLYYRILRDDNGTGAFHKLDSVPSSVFAYTDVSPPVSPNVHYMLNTIWSLTCSPKAAMGKGNKGNGSGDRMTSLNNYTFTSFSNFKIMNVTGVNSIDISNAINVYPNPANDVINITSDKAIDGTLSLTNVLGEQVYTGKFALSNNTAQVNISNLSTGVYFLKIESNGQMLLKKIVKL